ncbi:hypothetical protein Tco_1118870 [Tanacetum coccineum]
MMSHQLRTLLQISLAMPQPKKMWLDDSTLPLHEGHPIIGMSIPREDSPIANILLGRELGKADLIDNIVEICGMVSPYNGTRLVPGPLIVFETIRCEAVLILFKPKEPII